MPAGLCRGVPACLCRIVPMAWCPGVPAGWVVVCKRRGFPGCRRRVSLDVGKDVYST